MINNIIATIKVMVSAFVNVFIVVFGTAAIIVVKLFAFLDIASMLIYTILVNEVKSPVAEATIMVIIAGIMK